MTDRIQKRTGKIVLGCEHFLVDHLDLVKGKRLGLVTNQSGVDSRLNSLIDLFYENPAIDLVALYGPEHGIKGNSQAGQSISFYRDEKYDLPVFSLYCQPISSHSQRERSKDLDEQMRSFDTISSGKILEKPMVANLDAMVFDIQDIGTRIFTYIATMAYCMRVCTEMGLEFIVLDRPNPINGKDMEGPVLEFPEFSSFVGIYPVPVRHGMTIGELAQLFNDRFLSRKVNLTVIPMMGWKRNMWYDQTGLPWVFPSPNIPTLQTATVYPGQVFLEGTNISEGRGTTKPFEIFGAPWINGQELTQRLNELALPGVKFRESWFTPFFSKYKDELCSGTEIHVNDRNIFQPFLTTLNSIKLIREMYPRQFQFHDEYFDKIIGSATIRNAIEREARMEEIRGSYASRLEEFKNLRKGYLHY